MKRSPTPSHEAYSVDRHSGRSEGKYRVIVAEADETHARAMYEQIAEDLRQGAVRLLRNGKPIAMTTAPRLRSRW